MHSSKLTNLLRNEQYRVQQEELMLQHKRHVRMVKTKEFRNMSRSSSLLQKVLINKESNQEKDKIDLNKLRILQLQHIEQPKHSNKISVFGGRDPIRRRTSILVESKEIPDNYLPNLPEFSKPAKIQTIQSEVVAPHFMSAIMQDKYYSQFIRSDDIKNIVKDFLQGLQKETSLDNITQMYFSALTLYDSAKEMSKKLSKTSVGKESEDTDQMEYDILRNKFSNSIRNKSRIFKPKQQHIIFERNFGVQQERMIDQVGNKPKNARKTISNFDVFIPKNEITSLMNNFLNDAEKEIKIQHDNLMSHEVNQVNAFVNNMKKFKEGIKDMLYNMNHLRKMKQTTIIPNQQQQMNSKIPTINYPSPTLKGGNVLKYLLQTKSPRKKTVSNAENFSQAVVQQERVRELTDKIENDEYKSDLKQRMRKAFQNFFQKLQRLRLTLDDIVNKKAFPTNPFEHEGSLEFMRAVREQEVEVVEKLLKGYRFFVYDFDNNMKTALHHAASSNDLDMIKVLMENGSDLDSRDMIGRTALHFSVKIGNIDSTRILLVYGAHPSLKTIAGKQPLDFSKNHVIKALIKNAKKFHFMMELMPKKDRKNFWMNKAIPFFREADPDKIIKLQLYKTQARVFSNI